VEKGINIRIQGGERSGKNVVMTEGLNILRDGKLIIGDVNLDLEQGDSLGIFGPNGCGKSTLLKTLMGELPSTGDMWIAPGARVGYFSQGQEKLDPELTAEEHLLKAVGKDDSIVTYKEAEPFTTKVKQMDFLNSKAVRDLKHDPKVTPEDGIRRTVEWMKSIYHRER